MHFECRLDLEIDQKKGCNYGLSLLSNGNILLFLKLNL